MLNSLKIDGLLNACRTAATEEALTTALEELADAILKTDNGREYEIALHLIRQVVFVGNSSNPVMVSLDKCLDACGPEAALGACSQTFLEAGSIKIDSPCSLETSLRTVRRLLLTMPKTNDVSVWTQQLVRTPARSDIMARSSIDVIVSMALLLPSQIANACHFQKLVLPVWCVRSRYIPRLVECALAMDAVSNTADLYVHVLVQKIVHGGGSDEVAIAFYQCYHRSNPDPAWYRNTILETMRCLSTPRDCATLLRSILRHLLSKDSCPENENVQDFCRKRLQPYLDLVCQPILEYSKDYREAFVQLSILSSSSCSASADAKSDRVFCHCIAILLAACKTNDDDKDDDDDDDDESSGEEDYPLPAQQILSVLERHLIEVASCWSETVFVQRTDLILQRHVTNFIVCAISMLDKERNYPFSPLVGTTLNGVSVRLSSSIHEVRRDGMRVGEALAEYIDQPLKFEENEDDNESQQQKTPLVKEEVAPIGKPTSKTRKKSRRRKAPKEVDPDAEYISDEGSSTSSASCENSSENSDDDDSIWDDAETFIPYNLDDDEEDLRETQVPLYLRECLDMLRTPNANESALSRHETGIEAISSLVRSNPVDLPDLTVPLCRTLLTLENKFDLPEFNTNLASGLLSLTVMQPMLAGQCLIKDFFGGQYGLDVRLLILHSIEEAAYELCGTKALKEEREKRISER